MTDAQFLLEVLSDGEPHSQAAILRRAFDELGHGLTIHSRAADLRKAGHFVICERVPGKTRGEGWVYTLIGSLPSAEGPGRASADGSDPDHDRGRSAPSLSQETQGSGPLLPQSGPAPALFDLTEKPAWA